MYNLYINPTDKGVYKYVILKGQTWYISDDAKNWISEKNKRPRGYITMPFYCRIGLLVFQGRFKSLSKAKGLCKIDMLIS